MDDSEIEIATFGMFIIDEIDYITGQSKTEVIGGAGTYVAVGARLVAGQAYAKHIGWIVDRGSDFPEEFATVIDSWRTSVTYRSDLDRLTTRAWNGFEPGEQQHRNFRYTTPKLRLDVDSLPDQLLASNAFHMVCSSERCVSLVGGFEQRRQRRGFKSRSKPRIVWEPIPDLCLPSELDKLKPALKAVDIVSPNAEELAAFFGENGEIQTQAQMADWVLTASVGIDGRGALIVREGSEGSTIYTRKWSIHLPAYHTTASSSMVRDPTGGGNAYLGGLLMAMSRKVEPDMKSVEEIVRYTVGENVSSSLTDSVLICAAIYATIAASYVIEQPGMPLLSASSDGKVETWNGETFASRLAKYLAREKKQIEKSLQTKGSERDTVTRRVR